MMNQELFKTDPFFHRPGDQLLGYYIMQNNLHKDCDICSRLGRHECGYHQFKQQCLSTLARGGSLSPQPRSPPTSRTTPPPPPPANLPQYAKGSPISAEQVQRSNMFCQSQVTPVERSQVPFSARQQNTFQRENHHFERQMPTRSVRSVYQGEQNHFGVPHPQPPEAQMMRVEENGQVLYYPIYPVYEVVYEPVDPQTSSILSHSSLHP